MLKTLFLTISLSFVITVFCSGQNDNQELAGMYRADQSDRQQTNTNEDEDLESVLAMISRDSARLVRVHQLLDSNKVKTGQDYYHAAMICQHGHDIQESDTAIKLMRKAIELDSTINPWLLAAAIDRNLVKRGLPQIYGTQYIKDENNHYVRCYMDTTAISDEERKRFKVETLEEQRQKFKSLNKISLLTLLDEYKNIKKLESFCRKQWLNKDLSKYNLLEREFNNLGYHLMSQSRFSDAYIIFLLNTELYSNSSNAYDSLGECLLKLNKVKEGLVAYKRSLELDPHNENAQNILNTHSKGIK